MGQDAEDGQEGRHNRKRFPATRFLHCSHGAAKARQGAIKLRGQTAGLLTDGRAIEEEGHPEQHPHTQGQDERAPAAPAQGAAVTGGADEGREDEAEDGAQEPSEAIVLLWEACGETVLGVRCRGADTYRRTQTQKHMGITNTGTLGCMCTYIYADIGTHEQTQACRHTDTYMQIWAHRHTDGSTR